MPKDQYYLKCKYYLGMFKGEYSIKFKPYNKKPGDQDWCLVNKEDVLVVDSDKNKGLARIVLLSIKGDKALIGINDVGDHRESRFYVEKKCILKNCSAADAFRNNPVPKYLLNNHFVIAYARRLSQHKTRGYFSVPLERPRS